MEYLLYGIGWGLWLAILVGPLVFALIQTTLEKGTPAGFTVGLGIWLSDILFIIGFFMAADAMRELTAYENFELVVGIIGGLILLGIGTGIYINTPKELPKPSFKASKDILANGVKGFAINTFNPFTFVFWLGMIPSYVQTNKMDNTQIFIFIFAILGTIILTDGLKIVFAKILQPNLTLKNIISVRKISGAALVIFGIALIIKVLT